MKRAAFALAILIGAALACSSANLTGPVPTPYLQTAVPAESATFTPSPTPLATDTPLPTDTPIFTPTPLIGETATPEPSPTPFGCGPCPIDDYTRIPVREWVVKS